MITAQKHDEPQSEQERLRTEHQKLMAEHQKSMDEMAQAEIEQAAYRAEIGSLETELQGLDNDLKEYDENRKLAKLSDEQFRQEMSGWTICHACDIIDESGGATCYECGGETRPFEISEEDKTPEGETQSFEISKEDVTPEAAKTAGKPPHKNSSAKMRRYAETKAKAKELLRRMGGDHGSDTSHQLFIF